MKSMMKVQAIGHAGKDAESQYKGEKFLCTFSMAVTDVRKRNDGEKDKHTEWFDVTAWGKLGELINSRVRKGDPVYVEGKFRSREWEYEGKTYFRNEIKCNDIVFLKPGENPRDALDDERLSEIEDELPFE